MCTLHSRTRFSHYKKFSAFWSIILFCFRDYQWFFYLDLLYIIQSHNYISYKRKLVLIFLVYTFYTSFIESTVEFAASRGILFLFLFFAWAYSMSITFLSGEVCLLITGISIRQKRNSFNWIILPRENW